VQGERSIHRELHGDASCVAKKGRFTEANGINSKLATPIGVASPEMGAKTKTAPGRQELCGSANALPGFSLAAGHGGEG
jgi:hypothetical protein